GFAPAPAPGPHASRPGPALGAQIPPARAETRFARPSTFNGPRLTHPSLFARRHASAGGGQIVYAGFKKDANGYWTIRDGLWLMDANGANRVRVPTPPEVNNQFSFNNVSWAGDGTKVLFEDTTTSPYPYYLMNANGSDKKPAGFTAADVTNPVISPNGRQIAFVGSAGKAGLFVQNLGSGKPVRYGSITPSYVAWSPDGKRIVALADGYYQVAVSPAGGKPAKIPITTPDTSPSLGRPSYTPDGRDIIFVSTSSADYNCRLYRVSVKGGAATMIPGGIDSLERINAPQVSPDGKLIAFDQPDGGAADVRVIPTSGGSITNLIVGVFLGWRPQPKPGITGTVLRGSKVGVPELPSHPVPGVDVTVRGTTSIGQKFFDSTTTAGDGTYAVEAPKGQYKVTFPPGVCARVGGAKCSLSGQVAVGATGARLDAVALIGVLQVSVTPNPRLLTLELDRKTGTNTPQSVNVTVTVKNIGVSAVDSVTAPPNLIVSYNKDNPPAVPVVPIRPESGPCDPARSKPGKCVPNAKLGTLKPGKSVTVLYTLKAAGDGKYDIQGLVIGSQPGIKRIAGVGTGQLKVGAPVLVMTEKIGKQVHSPNNPTLVKAGTAMTINITVENLSYVKTIALAPYYPRLVGNAFDGHVQYRDEPIQNVAGIAAVQPSDWVQLDPRQKIDLESVIRTTSTPADVLVGQKQTGGGTRASITIPDPKVFELTKDDGLGPPLLAADVFVDGETHYEIGLDDSDFRTPPQPFTYVGAYWYFSKGQMIGLWNLTAGGLAQLFSSLPTLVKDGITAVNGGIEATMVAEMELWEEVKNDPVLRAQFLTLVGNQTLLAYKHAPKLIKNIGEFKAKVDKSVLDGYTKIANDWYSGDWSDAMTEMAREGTERTGDLAMAIAPGLLVRDGKVLAAFQATKERVYAQVTEDLAAYAPKLVSAFESIDLLNSIVKPGFQLADAHLRQLFGLTVAESDFLRELAKNNRLLIVIRSRAAESVKWIKKFGAVLKPEAIKLKNVSELDVKYLGYAESDTGRVIIRRKLPSASQVEAQLSREGFVSSDAEWKDALTRLTQREEELTKVKDGFVPYLEKAAKDGYIDMNWNFADNSVDPTFYTKGKPTRYEFRLADYEGTSTFKRPCVQATANCVPEFFVNNKWRSITGDVDFLQITRANGAALTDAERVAIYKQISESVIGLMHPESATWTDLKNNLFNFETKVNEFVRAGTCAQFGPDGLARAVTFNQGLTKFVSKQLYRVGWNGGYMNPLGPVAP
ncbi:MAG TPA: hypothetical protein VG815_18525, partial [Chloroflexota bacterium]|nr:hypothetical protein [Chloroflexota bacterium]